MKPMAPIKAKAALCKPRALKRSAEYETRIWVTAPVLARTRTTAEKCHALRGSGTQGPTHHTPPHKAAPSSTAPADQRTVGQQQSRARTAKVS